MPREMLDDLAHELNDDERLSTSAWKARRTQSTKESSRLMKKAKAREAGLKVEEPKGTDFQWRTAVGASEARAGMLSNALEQHKSGLLGEDFNLNNLHPDVVNRSRARGAIMPKETEFKDLGEKATTLNQGSRSYVQTKMAAGIERSALKAHRGVKTWMKDQAKQKTAVDLGESVPGATEAQGLRARAIAKAQLGKASSLPKSDPTPKMNLSVQPVMEPDFSPNVGKPRTPVRPTLTTDSGDMAGSFRPGKAPKDLGRKAVSLIRKAGVEGSTVSAGGGKLLMKALAKKLSGGVLGIAGGIGGAADAAEQYKQMNTGPNYINLNTGKVKKRMGAPRVES